MWAESEEAARQHRGVTWTGNRGAGDALHCRVLLRGNRRLPHSRNTRNDTRRRQSLSLWVLFYSVHDVCVCGFLVG